MNKTNFIHPTAIIGKDVKIGSNNTIGAFSIIDGNTIIGNNNTIGPHVFIGCEPTDSKHIERDLKSMSLRIGDNNNIREYCLIEHPCYENETVIGNNVFLMQGVHISHDVHLYDNVVITNQSVVAGIVKILEGANIAMSCCINQYTVIGQYSISAANSAVMKNVKPFSRYIPNKPNSVNYYAISKFGFEEYTEEIEKYVLRDIQPVSKKMISIVNVFDEWVAKYGHKTY